MTTAETIKLGEEFRRRADACREAGDTAGMAAWQSAHALLSDAEGKSITASWERSQRRAKRATA